MNKIDAMGLACPIPVVKARNALKEIEGIGEIIISVDNRTSVENLTKLAKNLGCDIETNEIDKFHYEVTIKKTREFSDGGALSNGETIVVIDSQKMGEGDDDLGISLMKAFIYALSEADTVPYKIFFLNSGVKLTAEGSPCADDIKAIEKRGAGVFVCGACINHYGITDKIAVGEVTNMYAILEAMNQANKIIKP